jgi:nucleoside-triphosphatase THEP1
MLEPKIVLLTGNRQIGKSTACFRLADMLRQTDLKVSGLLTQRTGEHDLRVTELLSGETYPLTLPANSDTGSVVGHFRFASEAIARSEKALDTCFPTQIFILDEIGPLELIYGQGWARALKLLRRFNYRVAFVVVRPELVVRAICQLPVSFYAVIHITAEIRNSVPAALLAIATDACFTEERPPTPEIL